MRKMTKKSLDELAKTMPVITESEMMQYWGGKAYNMGGKGTLENPVKLQATFNLVSYSFGDASTNYSMSSAIKAGINEFNNFGVQKVGDMYYEFEMVINEIKSPQDHYPYTPGETAIVGNKAVVESEQTSGAHRIGGADDSVNGASGIALYYNTAKLYYGSGADFYDAIQRATVHEIGHSLGLGEYSDTNKYNIMDQFSGSSMPGKLDSGTVVKIIELNKNNDPVKK